MVRQTAAGFSLSSPAHPKPAHSAAWSPHSHVRPVPDIILDNSLAGHVIGTVDTYTGLPGLVASPAITTTPSTTRYAWPVQPQTARADGSIIHIAQEGDTVWTIAVAYAVSPYEIIEVNQLANGGRHILIGQELLIHDAG